jgi:hypothetical protein
MFCMLVLIYTSGLHEKRFSCRRRHHAQMPHASSNAFLVFILRFARFSALRNSSIQCFPASRKHGATIFDSRTPNDIILMPMPLKAGVLRARICQARASYTDTHTDTHTDRALRPAATPRGFFLGRVLFAKGGVFHRCDAGSGPR